jgi:hypothetical protein
MVRFLMCTVYTPRSSMSRGNGSASVRIYSVMIRCEYPLTIRIVRPHSFEHIDLHNYFCKIGKRDYVSSERSPSARGNGHLMSCGHSTPRTAGHQERAKINAQREAADSRNAVLGFEFCPRCPAVCPTTACLENRRTRAIKTYQVDPDRPTYVSYYLARLKRLPAMWRVGREPVGRHPDPQCRPPAPGESRLRHQAIAHGLRRCRGDCRLEERGGRSRGAESPNGRRGPVGTRPGRALPSSMRADHGRWRRSTDGPAGNGVESAHPGPGPRFIAYHTAH